MDSVRQGGVGGAGGGGGNEALMKVMKDSNLKLTVGFKANPTCTLGVLTCTLLLTSTPSRSSSPPRSGYDTYTPHRNIVFHDYKHGPETKNANAWARKWRELQRSHERLRTLLGRLRGRPCLVATGLIDPWRSRVLGCANSFAVATATTAPPPGMPHAIVKRDTPEAAKLLGKWDLGSQRSLDQLINFTGVDSRNYEILHTSCNKLHWVPFKEAPDHDWLDGDERVKWVAAQTATNMAGKDREEPPPALTVQRPEAPQGQ